LASAVTNELFGAPPGNKAWRQFLETNKELVETHLRAVKTEDRICQIVSVLAHSKVNIAARSGTVTPEMVMWITKLRGQTAIIAGRDCASRLGSSRFGQYSGVERERPIKRWMPVVAGTRSRASRRFCRKSWDVVDYYVLKCRPETQVAPKVYQGYTLEVATPSHATAPAIRRSLRHFRGMRIIVTAKSGLGAPRIKSLKIPPSAKLGKVFIDDKEIHGYSEGSLRAAIQQRLSKIKLEI
jgi:hypothetical protein